MRHDKLHFFDASGDERMQKQNIPAWEAFAAFMLAHTEWLPKGRWDILDVGCHTGGMLQCFGEKLDGHIQSLSGVEPIDACLQAAQKRVEFGTFHSRIEYVSDASIDVLVSHEALYLVENLELWIAQVKRVLRPNGVAFVALRSHGENAPWMRWRKILQPLYGHESTVHFPLDVLEAGHAAGYKMEMGRLPVSQGPACSFHPPEDGWGEFLSAKEWMDYQLLKYVFCFWPNT